MAQKSNPTPYFLRLLKNDPHAFGVESPVIDFQAHESLIAAEIRMSAGFIPRFRVFIRLSAAFRCTTPFAVDQRQPNSPPIRVRLSAAMVNTGCAVTFFTPRSLVAQPANRLGRTKDLFDTFADLEAGPIARMTRATPVDQRSVPPAA